MNFVKKFTYTGSAKLSGEDFSEVVALLRQNRFDPHERASVHIVGGEWFRFWQNEVLPGNIEITHRHSGGSIVLSDIGGQKLRGEEAYLEIGEWTEISTADEIPAGAKITVRVYLSDRGYVRDRRGVSSRGDGQVERSGEIDPQPEWKSDDQAWKLGIRYHYEALGDDTPANESRALVPAAQMRGEWIAKSPTNLKAVLAEVATSVLDPLRVYSFLSRQRVAWYQIEVSYVFESRANEFATRRRAVKRSQLAHLVPMFPQEPASRQAFPMLLNAIRSASERERIARAIDFVVGAWSADGTNSARILMHAALETIVGVIDEKKFRPKPTNRQIKNLEEKVRGAIEAATSAGGWDPVAASYVIGKVAELKRPPIIELVVLYVSLLKIEISDLWHNQDQFRSELSLALKVRNNLVHAAEENDSPEATERLFALGLLTKRLILNFLGLNWVPHKG